jgi:hypothetical protein
MQGHGDQQRFAPEDNRPLGVTEWMLVVDPHGGFAPQAFFATDPTAAPAQIVACAVGSRSRLMRGTPYVLPSRPSA